MTATSWVCEEEEAVEKTFHMENMVFSGYKGEMGMTWGVRCRREKEPFSACLSVHSSRGYVSRNAAAIKVTPKWVGLGPLSCESEEWNSHTMKGEFWKEGFYPKKLDREKGRAPLQQGVGRVSQEWATIESHGLGVNKALEGRGKKEGVIRMKQVQFPPLVSRCLTMTSSVWIPEKGTLLS